MIARVRRTFRLYGKNAIGTKLLPSGLVQQFLPEAATAAAVARVERLTPCSYTEHTWSREGGYVYMCVCVWSLRSTCVV